jgi:hypothetical protein
MIQSGEWPAPELLEQIIAEGDAAIGPLIALTQTKRRGWPEAAPLCYAIGLLSILRPPSAIAHLVVAAKRCGEAVQQDVADALVCFDDPGFEALIELCQAPAVGGYTRSLYAAAAASAASDDPVRRSRLAEILRTLLEDRMAAARKERDDYDYLEKDSSDYSDDDDFDDEEDDFLDDDDEQIDQDDVPDEVDLSEEAELLDAADEIEGIAALEADPRKRGFTAGGGGSGIVKLHDDDEHDSDHLGGDATTGDDGDDELEEEVSEPPIGEEVAFLVGHLADLADPSAVPLIDTAFREALIDDSVISRASVDKCYDTGGMPSVVTPDWLTSYRSQYRTHLEDLTRLPSAGWLSTFAPLELEEDEYGQKDAELAPLPPPTAPIRNAERKVGRNEPCWCGSGKKYKKCHLGKDTLT